MNRDARPAMVLAALLLAAPPVDAQVVVRPAHVLTREQPAPLGFLSGLGVAGPGRLAARDVLDTAARIAQATPGARAALWATLQAAAEARASALGAGAPYGEREPVFVTATGALRPPTTNRLQAPFGTRERLASDTTERHTGLTFAPTPSLDAYAIAAGVVVFCDTIDGLGLVVVIDHGRGWLSVYANLARADATPMAAVEAGALIGAIGAGSAMGADGLYLELRRDGIPVDPEPWLDL